MLGRLIQFCTKEWLIVLLLVSLGIGYGWYATQTVPLDAIPNVGENQVIVFTPWPGRSPQDVEDQVTYPLSVSLLGLPKAQSVRGNSMFGYSFVQVTFDDGTDFYWARTRVLESLQTVTGRLPEGVSPQLGPDATALGQVLYYTLKPTAEGADRADLAQLRSLQDFVVKYALESVEGVSEVASIGGYCRQYQVEIDPDKLRFHNIPLQSVASAIQRSSLDVGAKTIESGGMEYIIRGRGLLGGQRASQDQFQRTLRQIEQTVVRTDQGVPVRIRDVAEVQLGPEFRRGALDFNGTEAVGGVVVMRVGQNPRAVVQRVKQKIAQLEPSLEGVTIHVVYDRTDLINETVSTLADALVQEVLITVVVVALFLLHLRASLVVASALPVAVLLAFVAMHEFGVDANIMSLAGIAIAVGTMVDMAIIVSENVYSHLADWQSQGRPGGSRRRVSVIQGAAAEVAPAVLTAVSTTVVSFLPVFFLTGRDYRLFTPLAWTKTFALVASLVVAVVLVPLLARILLTSHRRTLWAGLLSACSVSLIAALLTHFVWGETLVRWLEASEGFWTTGGAPISEGSPELHGATHSRHWWTISTLTATAAMLGFLGGWSLAGEQLRPASDNPLSWVLSKLYAPLLRLSLRGKLWFLAIPVALVVLGLGAWFGLPALLRPAEDVTRLLGAELNEVPGYVQLKHTFTGLQSDDWIALDEGSWFYMPTLYPAASLSQAMQVLQTQDTLIHQIPEVQNVLGKIGRVESALDPAPAAMIETYVMLKPRDQWRPGVTRETIWQQVNRLGTLPGVTPASPLQPIEGRVVMLQSGIKASMAIRIYGDSLNGLAGASQEIAALLRQNPSVDSGTVNPDVVLGKPYVEFEVDRQQAARYGMSVAEVNRFVEAAVGGTHLLQSAEGRERYSVQIRYQRDYRAEIDELTDIPVVTPQGNVVRLGQLSSVRTSWGPGAIRSENARLVAHVSFSPSGQLGDLATVEAVMQQLRAAQLQRRLSLPAGYELQAVGSFQAQVAANRRLLWLVPLAAGSILLLVYLQFRRVLVTLAVFSGIPVAFAGGLILLGVYEIELNTAVWIGFIALFGIAVDDGVMMGTYLEQRLSQRAWRTKEEIRQAVVEAGLRRLRPCLMTTATTLVALVPVLVSTGRGADVAKAMALPVFGGMLVEPISLILVPVVYCAFQEIKSPADH